MALEDKFEGLSRLVQMGKEKGYVLYDEVSEVLPVDLAGGAELEDVLAGLDTAGIEILEEPKDFEKKLEEGEDFLDLDLPAGVGEKINDPVRMYLREMGTVPLLTREGAPHWWFRRWSSWATRWPRTPSRRATSSRFPIPS